MSSTPKFFICCPVLQKPAARSGKPTFGRKSPYIPCSISHRIYFGCVGGGTGVSGTAFGSPPGLDPGVIAGTNDGSSLGGTGNVLIVGTVIYSFGCVGCSRS